ncbi:MAG: hypothetical protein WCV50_04920 [Patescibacteria group bacterium]
MTRKLCALILAVTLLFMVSVVWANPIPPAISAESWDGWSNKDVSPPSSVLPVSSNAMQELSPMVLTALQYVAPMNADRLVVNTANPAVIDNYLASCAVSSNKLTAAYLTASSPPISNTESLARCDDYLNISPQNRQQLNSSIELAERTTTASANEPRECVAYPAHIVGFEQKSIEHGPQFPVLSVWIEDGPVIPVFAKLAPFAGTTGLILV